MPPQPPPRPPILRPPPLPPKGQPPLIPQRPVMTPTDELTNAVAHLTPPLPIPIRKPKQQQQQQQQQQQPLKVSKKPIQVKLSQISLMQLSDMSLGELAATLHLPPARLACMTLTELALRLAELKEDVEEDEVVEEEEEVVEELKVSEDQEAEVCYKGGKKYEILSNAHELEDLTHRVKNPSTSSTTLNCASERDRYAALREIMEQDLAEVIVPQDQFANFDCIGDDVADVGDSATGDLERDAALELTHSDHVITQLIYLEIFEMIKTQFLTFKIENADQKVSFSQLIAVSALKML